MVRQMFYLYVTDPNLLGNDDHKKNYGRVGALIANSVDPISQIPGTAVKELVHTEHSDWDETVADFVYNRGDRFISVDEFFDRFTDAELADYYANVPARAERAFNHKAALRKRIDLDSQWLSDIMQSMVTAGLLTGARRNAILQ